MSLYGKQNSFQNERLSMASCALHLEKAHILFVLAKERFRYQPQAAETISIPRDGDWGFFPFIPLDKAPILGYKKEDSFKAACK